MRNIKITAVIIGLLFMASCVKDDTVIIQPVVTKTVSFKKDLVPLFTKNCALGGCHNDGGKAPVLTSAKAYNSLKADAAYINVSHPENSELYQFLTGKLSPAMPMGASTNPGNLNAYVLAWIKQGAKNN